MSYGTTPTPEFEAWAKSFSGCDGGDRSAPVWFCGIEDGIDPSDPQKIAQSIDIQSWVQDVADWNNNSGPKGVSIHDDPHRDFFERSEYDRIVLKLHANIFGDRDDLEAPFYSNYAKTHNPYAKNFDREKKGCLPNRSIFKLNLFPLAFNQDDNAEEWQTSHIKSTGFLTKDLYKAWCVENRIKNISSWIPSDHQPKVIIGTGKYLNEFLLAFRKNNSLEKHLSTLNEIYSGSDKDKLTIEKKVKGKDSPLKCYSHYRVGEPLLIVIPFLRVGCLSAHKDIMSVGKWIKELLDSKSIVL